MDAATLIARICDPDYPFDQLAHDIDVHFPAERIDEELLETLRLVLRDLQVRPAKTDPPHAHGTTDAALSVQDVDQIQAVIIRGMLPGARLAPRGVAAALDPYGMWANRKNIKPINLDLLRVAAWAYHWAGHEKGRARALINLAEGLFIRDQFAAAIEAAQAGSGFFIDAGITLGINKARQVQANALTELHRFAEAEPLFEQLRYDTYAIAAAEATDRDAWVMHIELLNSYAFALETLCDNVARAAELHRYAATLLPLTGPDSLCAFHLYYTRGQIDLRLGKLADARRSFDRAEVWLNTGLREETVTLADAYDLYQAQLVLALMLDDHDNAQRKLITLEQCVQQGEDSPKQRAELDRMRALLAPDPATFSILMQAAIRGFQAIGADLLVLDCYRAWAEYAYMAGDLHQGAQALAAAEQILQQHTLPRRALDLQRIDAQYHPERSIAQQIHVATQLAEAGDYLAAAAVWEAVGRRQCDQDAAAARAAYAQALDAIDRARGSVRLSSHTLRLQHARRRAGEGALRLADAAEAFELSERLRAQSLLEEISNAGLWQLLAGADFAEIRAAYEQFICARARLFPAETRLKRPTVSAAAAADTTPAALNAYRIAEAAYFAALDRIADTKAAQVGWMRGTPALRTEIQAALPAQALFITYTVMEPAGRPELWAIMLSPEGETHKILVEDARGWALFQKGWSWQPDAIKRSVLQQVYATFFVRLEPYLAGVEHLCIAFDEHMERYPLHAAHDGAHYLLESKQISYIPSGSVLHLLRQRHHHTTPNTRAVRFLGYDARDEADYAPLPALETYLQTWANIFGAQAHHGPFAPEAILALMRDARIVHLSCHGAFLPNASPRFAHLITGPTRLYADDLYRSAVSLDLLFLDACHSGQVGPGMQGFIGAALVAGVSSVIGALWQVEYRHTRALVAAFYRYLQNGLTVGAALRQAQLELLRQSPKPADWAPFFLTGLPDLHISI
jgi:CHAT domain-containing protein